MMRDHPLMYVSDMSTLMAPTYGEPSSNPIQHHDLAPSNQNPSQVKRKRSVPGNPDPEAEVVALSPKSLLATNRFLCEICGKGFQRDQNLQLHRRGHNLPWKLKQRSEKEVRKKVYTCPEVTCVHHDPSRALGDLTGIKKHFCRKHWEKKWKCERCGKKYAVQSDWKAHVKICGTKEYRCSCGTLFSRRDSFTTHRAFCDALSQENLRSITANPLTFHNSLLFLQPQSSSSSSAAHDHNSAYQIEPPMQTSFPLAINTYGFQDHHQLKREEQQEVVPPSWVPSQTLNNMELPSSIFSSGPSSYQISPSPHMSATALLQTAAQMGVTIRTKPIISQDDNQLVNNGYVAAATTASLVHGNIGVDGSIDDAFGGMLGLKRQETDVAAAAGLVKRKEERSSSDRLTRDFLGLKALYSGDIVNLAGVDPQQRGSEYDQMQQMGGAWHV